MIREAINRRKDMTKAAGQEAPGIRRARLGAAAEMELGWRGRETADPSGTRVEGESTPREINIGDTRRCDIGDG
jgi:hypothetical protein